MKPECQKGLSHYKQGFALKRFSDSRVSPAAGLGMKEGPSDTGHIPHCPPHLKINSFLIERRERKASLLSSNCPTAQCQKIASLSFFSFFFRLN